MSGGNNTIFLNIILTILSGFGTGIGISIIKSVRNVKVWMVSITKSKLQNRIYVLGGCAVGAALAALGCSALLLGRVSAAKIPICVIIELLLWAICFAIGFVSGNLIAHRAREYPKESLNKLTAFEIMQKATSAVYICDGVLVGFDGIAFIGSAGEVTEIMYFADFGLKNLTSKYQTDILCQYLNLSESICEIHFSASKLSCVINTVSIR